MLNTIIDSLRNIPLIDLSDDELKIQIEETLLLDQSQNLPLIWGAVNANLDRRIIKLLLDLGCNVNITNNNGESALIRALENFHSHNDELVNRYKNFGIQVPVDFINNSTYSQTVLNHLIPLSEEKQKKIYYKEIVELLCNEDIDINKEHQGITPLQLAIMSSNNQAVKLLCDRGADISPSYMNKPVLALLNLSNPSLKLVTTDIAMSLISRGADPNSLLSNDILIVLSGTFGFGSGSISGPLIMKAVKHNNVALVQSLLVYGGANPYLNNEKGVNAKELAAELKNDCKKIITDYENLSEKLKNMLWEPIKQIESGVSFEEAFKPLIQKYNITKNIQNDLSEKLNKNTFADLKMQVKLNFVESLIEWIINLFTGNEDYLKIRKVVNHLAEQVVKAELSYVVDEGFINENAIDDGFDANRKINHYNFFNSKGSAQPMQHNVKSDLAQKLI